MHEEDDVATALVALQKGLVVVGEGGSFSVRLEEDIPFGHKFAVRSLAAGELVHKYGQVIGQATQDIRQGEHVHVQNVGSRRGRGDLNKEGSQ